MYRLIPPFIKHQIEYKHHNDLNIIYIGTLSYKNIYIISYSFQQKNMNIRVLSPIQCIEEINILGEKERQYVINTQQRTNMYSAQIYKSKNNVICTLCSVFLSRISFFRIKDSQNTRTPTVEDLYLMKINNCIGYWVTLYICSN